MKKLFLLFILTICWRNKIVNAQVSFNYKGEQYLDEVNTEESKLEAFNFIDLHLWRPVYKGLSASLMIHNLFNQDFVDSRNMIAPGRMFSFELKYSLYNF